MEIYAVKISLSQKCRNCIKLKSSLFLSFFSLKEAYFNVSRLQNLLISEEVERNICHRKSNKAVIKQLRIEKHANLFFFSFSATSFINFSHSEQFLGKVGFHAESIVFFTFLFNSL